MGMSETKKHIPHGWDSQPIGALVTEQLKSTIKVSEASGFGAYPFFTSGDDILVHSQPLIDGKTIFLATGGQANVKYYDGDAAYSTDTYALKSNGQIAAKLLFYDLDTMASYIDGHYFQGSGLKHLQKKDLKRHELCFPKDKKEQQRIVQLLTCLDEAIAKTEALIEKYRRIKQGMMHDLLTYGIDKDGNIRSPKTHRFKPSRLGMIPEEWECSSIGEKCYVTKLAGYEFTKYIHYQDHGEIVALRALNIKHEKIVLDDVRYISRETSNLLSRSKLYAGDILITYIGAYIGDIAQVRENDRFHLAPNIAKIVAGEDILSDFLENILRSEKVQFYFKTLITTTANPSLTMGQIRSSYIVYPKDKLEQKIICERFRNINNIIYKEKASLAKLCAERQGLLNDLLTGKVRIPETVNI